MKKFLLLGMFICSYGFAGSFVVPSGTTETNSQLLSGTGSQGLIEEEGAISVTNASGVIAEAAASGSILNYGSISVTELGSSSILTIANSHFLVDNYGSVSSSGTFSSGVNNDSGSFFVLNNYGSIAVSGLGASGVINDNANNSMLSNYGSIFATGQNSITIDLDGSNCTLYNFGEIISSDTTTGGDCYGIQNGGTNTFISNSGYISSRDNAGNENDAAIYNSGTNMYLTNSGTIEGNDYALYSTTDPSPNLSLLLNSTIIGPVHVDTGSLNLSVETGLNLLLTLDASSTSFGSLNIQAPYVVKDDPAIAVIDPTAFVMQADITADISDSVLTAIYLPHPCCGLGFWAEGVGSYRKRHPQSQTLTYQDWVTGLLVGYIGKNHLSFFGGCLYTKGLIQDAPQEASIVSGCGGFSYENRLYNTFIGLSAFGAYVHWYNTRTVMNNLAPHGKERASVNINGAMVAADMTLGRDLHSWFFHPYLRFNLRYAETFLGHYIEEGSTADLTMKHRNVALLTTRLEAAFYRVLHFIEPFIGVFGRYQVAGKGIFGRALRGAFLFLPSRSH